jgi:hypothetical protein
MKHFYRCKNCGFHNNSKDNLKECKECGKEICVYCGESELCLDCEDGLSKSIEKLILKNNKMTMKEYMELYKEE